MHIQDAVKAHLLKTAYQHFDAYTEWIKSQQISAHDRGTELCRINHFLVFLGTEFSGEENIFSDSFRRDEALYQYKRYLRETLRSTVNTINTDIWSVDQFFQFLGMVPTRVKPEIATPTKALSEKDQQRLSMILRAETSSREATIITFLLEVGLTAEECAELNLNDVRFTTTGGFVIITRQKTRFRFHLESKTKLTLRQYLAERADNYPFMEQPALLIDNRGQRLSPAAIDLFVREAGKKLGFDLTARSLRQSYLFIEAKKENNALLAAELLNGTAAI
ncbi:MAG TPA: tyrosine-type recombinase/integrase [Planktothrix sp.]|jgi:integrase